jgi:hypothetical protein
MPSEAVHQQDHPTLVHIHQNIVAPSCLQEFEFDDVIQISRGN